MKNLKERWGVKNSLDVVIILVVFACTGFSILYLKRGIISLLNISSTAGRWAFSLLVILPLYQVVLLFYGWLFGKFQFFWAFEKRIFDRIKRWF